MNFDNKKDISSDKDDECYYCGNSIELCICVCPYCGEKNSCECCLHDAATGG